MKRQVRSNVFSLQKTSLAAVLGLLAAGGAIGGEVAWAPQNGSTDISAPDNWGGNLPAAGDVKSFAGSAAAGDYTVTIPSATVEEPYRDKAGLRINVNNGQKVTFDATGTSWLQMTDAGAEWYGNMVLRAIAGDHMFNIEGVNVNSDRDNFGFTLTDGKISFRRDDANGSQLVFESGYFNNAFLPDGTTSPHSTVLFHSGSAPANSKVVLGGGEATLRYVAIRGKSAGSELLVTNGSHHVYGGLVINTAHNTDIGIDSTLHVSGGTLTVEDNSVWLGRDSGDKGVLKVDGDGTFVVGSGADTFYFPDGATHTGFLSVGGHGTWTHNGAKNIHVGQNGGTADILVEDDGLLQTTGSGTFIFASANGSHASMTLKDRARVKFAKATMVKDVNAGMTRTGVLTLGDDSLLEIVHSGQWANKDGSDFTLNMSGNAEIRAQQDNSRWIQFGNNNAAKITLNLAGGTIGGIDGGDLVHFQLRGGPQSAYTFSGVTLNTENFAVEGKSDTSAPDAWTVARQTGGVVNIRQHGSGDGLDIRGGNGRNAMYLLEGGVLNVGNMIRVGHNNTDSSGQWQSVFKQTGGQANISASVNMCDSATMAEFVLRGGRTRLYTIRGWKQSKAYNADGAWATALFDGGTIEPWSNGNKVISTMPELRLGAAGLTIDTLAFDNVLIFAKFQNEGAGTGNEVEGLFVKTGSGTLKAAMSETEGLYVDRDIRSSHSRTRIDQGTLLLTGAADAAFGRNITIKGGATLSLEGTASTLEVDTLAIGDGPGLAHVKIDSGDRIVVNDANGLSVSIGVIDASWATANGVYPVFTFKNGADMAEFDSLVVHSDARKDYAWESSVDDVTGDTVVSLVVADEGTLTRTIAYSGGVAVTNGTGRVSALTAEESFSQSGSLPLASAATASVAAGETLTLSGPLAGIGTELSKTGSGKLVVNGGNPEFAGSFISQGGTLEIPLASAFGAVPLSFPLVLGNGTLRYTGGAVSFAAPLEMRGAAAAKSVILENDGDMSFNGVTHVRGTFVKKGAGTLEFDLPAGTFNAGNDAVDGDYGVNGGTLVFPESGDAPETKAGLCGFTIAEGTLRVKGAGADKTTFSTHNTSILGTGYDAKAAPVLEVIDARVNFGKGSRHGRFMLDYPDGAPVPEVRLTNAYFYANSAYWGGSTSPTRGGRGPLFFLKDSTIWADYNAIIGYAGYSSPEIDADNSGFETDGIQMLITARSLTADFHGTNAVFGSYNKLVTDDNNAGYITSQDHVTGTLKFRDGARMKTTRGLKFANSQLSVVFDGGIFEIVPHDVEGQRVKTSVWNRSGKGFTTQGAGLELLIADGCTHDFNFPVAGAGGVVKTGAGVFKFVSARSEGEKLIQHTGGTTVSNGTLVVDGSLVADGAGSFAVASGATLDLDGSTLAGATLSGAGVVSNGTLNATLAYGDGTALPTFSSVAGFLTVDFGRTSANPVDSSTAAAGIVVGRYSGSAPAGLKVKAVNTGISGARTTVTFSDGQIFAKIAPSGFAVLIR